MVGVAALTAKQSGSTEFGAALLVLVLVTAVAMVAHIDRRHHHRTEKLRLGASVGALAEIAATTAVALVLAACSLALAIT